MATKETVIRYQNGPNASSRSPQNIRVQRVPIHIYYRNCEHSDLGPLVSSFDPEDL